MFQTFLQVCLQFHPAELDQLEPTASCGDRPLPIPARLPRSHLPEPGRRASHPGRCEQRSVRGQPWQCHRCAFQHLNQLHLFALHWQGGDF